MRLTDASELAYQNYFIVGHDSFEDLTINSTSKDSFYYFQHKSKSLIKRFLLHRGLRTWKACEVKLIKNSAGTFEPRLTFEILDRSKKTLEEIEIDVTVRETKSVKARVALEDSHKELDDLLAFIHSLPEVANSASKYRVTPDNELSEALAKLDKDDVILEIASRYKGQITDKDLAIITGRRQSLDEFAKLLSDDNYFQSVKTQKDLKTEGVWQHFFEENVWIFGYGLQLLSCENLENRKLEIVTIGHDILDGAGKRTDALLKTRGQLSKTLICEFKTHKTRLLEKDTYRSGVFVPSDDLRGAVAQVQKTTHKISLKLSKSVETITETDGTPTGERLAFIRPKSVIVIGKLVEFNTTYGTNEDMLSSFELYRQQLNDIEILTYDELYERTKFIVED